MPEPLASPAATHNHSESLEFELIPASELEPDYTSAIQAASSRLIIMGMSMTYDEKTAPVLDLVLEKAGEIPNVLFLPDAFSQRFDAAKLSLNPFGKHATAIDAFMQYSRALEAKGADVRFTNPYPRWLSHPYKGRSHIKFVVANNEIFDFGGVDIKTTGFDNADSMVHYTSGEHADQLQRFAQLAYDLGQLTALADRRQDLDDESYVVTDMGLAGRSAIYDEAVRIFGGKDVTGITFLSQMRPTGTLEKALVAQQAETKLGRENVIVLTNRPEQLVKPAYVMETLRAKLSNLVVSHLAGGAYLHEKLALIRRHNAPTILIKGSHNLLEQGVNYGTAERTLFTTNPSLVGQAEDRVDALMAA